MPRAGRERGRESTYLCRAAGRYLARPPHPAEVVWRYAGVRPLYDDGSEDPSAITRDYTLRVDDAEGAAPVLSVFGGKITTYRRLAEHALDKLAPYFPGDEAGMDRRSAPLPGSDFTDARRRSASSSALSAGSRPTCCRGCSGATARSAHEVLGDGRLGEYYGAGLTERELALPHGARMGAHRRGRAVAAHEMRPAHDRGAAPARGAGGRAMKPLAELDARGVRAVLLDIDDTLTTDGRLTRRGLRRARAAAARRAARRAGDRAARRLVRSHRAHVAGGRGGRRERRVLFLPRRRAAAAALSQDEATPRRKARAPAGDRGAHPRRGARAARSPRTSPTARPTWRSTTARTCRRCRSKRRSASPR